MSTKRLKSFNIYGKLTLEVAVPIFAESLADAAFRSAQLSEKDFVDILGEYVDGELCISGVLEE